MRDYTCPFGGCRKKVRAMDRRCVSDALREMNDLSGWIVDDGGAVPVADYCERLRLELTIRDLPGT